MNSGIFPYNRIVVVGATGCGKSTLAERLANIFGFDFVELDSIYWKPGWVDSAPDEFRNAVDRATSAPCWVLAGNYGVVRDLVWSRAQALIWLDYPFFLVLGRLLKRIWTRWRSRELLWGTNRETLWVHLKLWSKDSLVNWLFQTYWKRKKTYPELFKQPQYSHLQIIRFSHPAEVETWLLSIPRRKKVGF